MGLTIHYSGTFRKDASLSEMITEVMDIAVISKWEYRVFETEFNAAHFGKAAYDGDVYGIMVTPPECEPLWLTFLSNGKMSGPAQLETYADEADHQEFLYFLFTKTQYAGVEVHKAIVNLLKYLDGKYFEELHVLDEGEYWEYGDERVLKANFHRYNELMENMALGMETIRREEDETAEHYMQRVAQRVKNRDKNAEGPC